MSYVTMKQMLETGVHFGHQTRRWNPKMRPFIFGARNGIHIIDLQQTVSLFAKAHDFIAQTVAEGHKILFVGTKRQAQEAVKSEAERSEMYFVTHRWMGGMLTNFQTIKKSIDRLKTLERMFEDGSIARFPKKEIVRMNREVVKLNNALGGIKDMTEVPGAAFVIDPKREHIAVAECRKLGVPVVAVVDTNCDPDLVDYIIPGNDDAIRAIKLFAQCIADACIEGGARFEELKAQRAAEKKQADAEAKKAEAEARKEKDAAKKAAARKDEKKAPAKKAPAQKAAPKKEAAKKDEPKAEAKPEAKEKKKEAKAEAPAEKKAEPKAEAEKPAEDKA